MELFDVISGRRSVREYQPQPPSQALIMRAIGAAVMAPSAVNAQPWSFTVVRDRPLLDEISRKAKASYEGPKVNYPNSGSGELRFVSKDALHANLVSGGIFAIPNHNPSIREKEFLVAGPFFTTAPSWVLGFLRIQPTVDRNLVEDESLFYAVFIFAPSGMTPSLT